jgi:malic enzyme
MAVPARPTSGTPIESLWGQVAHDSAVAQDIQSGTVTLTYVSSSTVTGAITFPRPFAAPPAVVIVGSGTVAIGCVAKVDSVTATQANIRVSDTQNVAHTSGSMVIQWIAIGPRA